MAIMILADQNFLNCDDLVTRYIPELAVYPGITINHILNHTIGLPYYYDIIDTTNVRSTNNSIACMAKMARPMFDPGERYEYSNSGYDVLPAIAKTITEIQNL